MSKAVLISIQPKWCELIASGKKTIEVRKTEPKIPTPFKCYIYQTKRTWIYNIYSKIADWQQKVIGEFVCDGILSHCEMANADIAEQQGCIKREDLIFYAGGKELYGWHISELKIYDKPKELSEFYKPCPVDNCAKCEHYYWTPKPCHGRTVRYCNAKPLNSPPQSWCYVEMQEDEQ